jgi:hypothetical protein
VATLAGGLAGSTTGTNLLPFNNVLGLQDVSHKKTYLVFADHFITSTISAVHQGCGSNSELETLPFGGRKRSKHARILETRLRGLGSSYGMMPCGMPRLFLQGHAILNS